MSAAIRLEVAQEQVAAMSAKRLAALDSDGCWCLAEQVGVSPLKLAQIVRRERYKRGLVKLSDLTPQDRRELIDRDNLDLHAIASGPIMDAGEIYLPAGKLSVAETRQREMKCILAATPEQSHDPVERMEGSSNG